MRIGGVDAGYSRIFGRGNWCACGAGSAVTVAIFVAMSKVGRFVILLRVLGSWRTRVVTENAKTGDISGERSDDCDKLQDWRRYMASMKSVGCQNLA